MKKIIFPIVTLLLSLMPFSLLAENVSYLVVDLADGSQTVVPLADQPVISCKGGELKVTVADDVKVSASLSDVRQYAFSIDVPTSVGSLMSKSEARLEQGHVYMANAKAGETVGIYKPGGQLVKQVRIGHDGLADIDLTALAKGLYIVKSANTSIKIINK